MPKSVNQDFKLLVWWPGYYLRVPKGFEAKIPKLVNQDFLMARLVARGYLSVLKGTCVCLNRVPKSVNQDFRWLGWGQGGT